MSSRGLSVTAETGERYGEKGSRLASTKEVLKIDLLSLTFFSFFFICSGFCHTLK